MKRLTTIGFILSLLALTLDISPTQASCYSYTGGVRKEQIKFRKGSAAYISVFSTKDLKREISRLRDGQVVTTLKFVEGNCGGSIYIRFKNSKGRVTYGWVFSDDFVFSIAD
jgi:hypothetical protein